MKLHRRIVLNPHFILEMSASITAMLVYASGFGRFRFVLSYATFLIFRAMFATCSATLKEFILVPIVIIALIFDVNHGAFYPVFDFNSIFLAGILLVVCDAAVRNLLQNKVDSIMSSDQFIICRNCSYMHSELVSECKKCGYNGSASEANTIEAMIIHRLINNNHKKNEDILYQMPLPKTRPFYKNGIRELRSELVMLKGCIAIIERIGSNAWRNGDIIPYDDIAAISGEMKRSYISKCPFLIIKCKNGSMLEIVLSILDDYDQLIRHVQSVAKKMNDEILIETNLPDKPDWWMLK